eukprot:10846705-Alexandrium_andersonii.AAC.1
MAIARLPPGGVLSPLRVRPQGGHRTPLLPPSAGRSVRRPQRRLCLRRAWQLIGRGAGGNGSGIP